MGECLIIRSGGGTDTSNANATAAQVLSGYTCYVNDTKITGTMPNCGTRSATLNAGGSFTIVEGHHNGSGVVTVRSLSDHTPGTAGAAHILSGKTAWVSGSKRTGTMTNRGAVSQSLAANGSYTIPAGWHNGSGKVNQSLTTQGAKSVTTKTTNQTACSANRWTTGTITIVGSSSLTAGNIKNGVWIFGVKGTFRGWVDADYVLINNGSVMSGVTYTHCTWDANDPSTSATVNPTPYIDSSKNNWLFINPSYGRCSAIYLPNCSGRTPKSNELTIEFWVEKNRISERNQCLEFFCSNSASHNGWHWVGGLGTRSYDYSKLSAWGSLAGDCIFNEWATDFDKTVTIGLNHYRYTGTWCGWLYITAENANDAPDLWIKKMWINWN